MARSHSETDPQADRGGGTRWSSRGWEGLGDTESHRLECQPSRTCSLGKPLSITQQRPAHCTPLPGCDLRPLSATCGRVTFHSRQSNPECQRASPGSLWMRDLQGGGVPDQPVQRRHHIREAWPVGSLLLPAVQHERVQGGGAVWGRGQAVVLLDGVDHLNKRRSYEGHAPTSPAAFIF